MAVILDQPTGLMPAFGPLTYLVEVGVPASIITAPALSFSVRGSSATVQPEGLVSPTRRIPSGSGVIYVFEPDVRSEVQSLLSMQMPPLGAPGVSTYSSLQEEIEVDFYEWIPDPNADERLVKAATPDVSDSFVAIPAYRRADEDQTLSQHQWSNQGPNNDPTDALTRKPVQSLISLGDSEWLPVWSEAMTNIRFRTFAADGTLLGDGVIETGFGTGPERMLLIGVGPANINNLSPADFVQGAPVTIDSNVARYQVQVGGICPNNFFLPFILNRNYYLKPAFCRQARVHFINSFGAPDSFSVWNDYTEEFQTSVFFSDRGRTDRSDPSLGARYRTSAEGTKRSRFGVAFLTKTQQQWLARELPMSVQVWVERNNVLEAVHMEGGTFVVSDTQEAVPTLSLEVIFSNTDNSQNQ